jgi:hypothetical protein
MWWTNGQCNEIPSLCQRQCPSQAKLDEGNFEAFKACSGKFVRGSISAKAYHDTVVRLGLASDVGQLMALCPNEARRREVLAIHDDYVKHGKRCSPRPCCLRAQLVHDTRCSFMRVHRAPCCVSF